MRHILDCHPSPAEPCRGFTGCEIGSTRRPTRPYPAPSAISHLSDGACSVKHMCGYSTVLTLRSSYVWRCVVPPSICFFLRAAETARIFRSSSKTSRDQVRRSSPVRRSVRPSVPCSTSACQRSLHTSSHASSFLLSFFYPLALPYPLPTRSGLEGYPGCRQFPDPKNASHRCIPLL